MGVEWLGNLIQSIWWQLLDTIFPEKCLGCRSRGEFLCEKCINNIKPAERETSGNIFACFDYRDKIIKQAIWALKYNNHRSLGIKLGKILYESMLEEISDLEIFSGGSDICVIPVPSSGKRIRNRGYNQAEIIARGFADQNSELFKLYTDIVFKKYDTKPQARIKNRKERLNNVKNVFDIKNKEKIKNKTILIIDDVTTTGGTINEIMKVLNKSGAKKVIGFAVAH